MFTAEFLAQVPPAQLRTMLNSLEIGKLTAPEFQKRIEKEYGGLKEEQRQKALASIKELLESMPPGFQVGKRLAWAEVIAVGPNVRAMELGDHVLFNPEDRYEVEVRGEDYVILRERDVHAVAATRLGQASTGLYL